MTMTKKIPAEPSLEYYKNQAKALVKDHKSRKPAALRRIRDFHPDHTSSPERALFTSEVTVRDAQLVIAREHGYPSWVRFKSDVVGRIYLPKLFEAIERSDTSGVRDILRNHPEIVSLKQDGATALHIAAAANNREAVDILLAYDADPDVRDDKYDALPRAWAHECGHTDLARHMVAESSSDDLQRAAGFGMTAEVKINLDEDPSRIDEVSGYGTALHYACLWGYPGVAALLLERGADPNLTTCNGDSALAIVRNQIDSGGKQTPRASKERRHEILEGCREIYQILLGDGEGGDR